MKVRKVIAPPFRRRQALPDLVEFSRTWPFTKLRTLFECPYRFWLAYAQKVGAPQPPLFVVGSVIHRVVDLFFSDQLPKWLRRMKLERIQTKEQMLKVLELIWFGVIAGRHGTEGFGSKPIQIAWAHENQKWSWLNTAKEVCAIFFDRYERLRGKPGLAVCREKRFSFEWMGFRLSGRIDRFDLVRQGKRVIMVDYKLGSHPELMPGSIEEFQPILYGLAYQENLRYELFATRPLEGIRIESLRTGEVCQLKPPTPEELDKLYQLLCFASALVQGTISGRRPENIPVGPNYPFRLAELEESLRRGTFIPRLPRDPRAHCSMCTFVPECIKWEKAESKPSAAAGWIARLAKVRSAQYPAQAELVFDV